MPDTGDQPRTRAPFKGRLAVIGAGAMGGAILRGLLAAGLPADRVVATARSQHSRDRLAGLGVRVTGDNHEAVAGAEVVLLAVKPRDAVAVLQHVTLDEGAVLLSVAAGITTSALEAAAPGARCVRVMPNTPALVGQAVSGISAGVSADEAALDVARAVMGAVGTVVLLPEAQQDLVVAASGSGVAYLYLMCEAMIEGAVTLGLPRNQARELVQQTFTGAAAMIATGEHPALLREAVTSPGGTTAAALQTLEAHGLRTAVAEAMRAAATRSAELG